MSYLNIFRTLSLSLLLAAPAFGTWLNCANSDGLVRMDRQESGAAHPKGWSYNGQDKLLPVVEERFDTRHQVVLLSAPGQTTTRKVFVVEVQLFGVKQKELARAYVTCGGEVRGNHTNEDDGYLPEVSNRDALLATR